MSTDDVAARCCTGPRRRDEHAVVVPAGGVAEVGHRDGGHVVATGPDDDVEQVSITLDGDHVHHVRRPRTRRLQGWQPDQADHEPAKER